MSWIHRTQSSFSESFFPVVIWGYFSIHHSPPWASKYPITNSTRTVLAKVFLRGKLYSVRWILRSQRSCSQSFFLIWSEDISFGPVVFKGIQNIPSQIPPTRCYQTDPGKNQVTLWDELAHDKAVSQKASFWFLSEDISIVTIRFNVFQNIPWQIPRKQC